MKPPTYPLPDDPEWWSYAGYIAQTSGNPLEMLPGLPASTTNMKAMAIGVWRATKGMAPLGSEPKKETT